MLGDMTGTWTITLSRVFRTFNVLFCVQGYLVLLLAGTKFIIMLIVVFPNAFSVHPSSRIFVFWALRFVIVSLWSSYIGGILID